MKMFSETERIKSQIFLNKSGMELILPKEKKIKATLKNHAELKALFT